MTDSLYESTALMELSVLSNTSPANRALLLALLVVAGVVAKVLFPLDSSSVPQRLTSSVHLHCPHMPNEAFTRPLVHSLHASSSQTRRSHRTTHLLHRLAPQALWPDRSTLSYRGRSCGSRCLQGDTQDWYQVYEERVVPTLGKLPKSRRLHHA
jgi:hypothetical protein